MLSLKDVLLSKVGIRMNSFHRFTMTELIEIGVEWEIDT